MPVHGSTISRRWSLIASLLLLLIQLLSTTTRTSIAGVAAAVNDNVPSGSGPSASGSSSTAFALFDNEPPADCPRCPECDDCSLPGKSCINFGDCVLSSGKCQCPLGFGGARCEAPLCGSLARGNNRTVRAPEQEECPCDAGWKGKNCNLCTEDSVCSSIANPRGEPDREATCYKGPITVRHAFASCPIVNKFFSTIISDPVSATFQCNREIKSCRFEFWIKNQENFDCKLEECTFLAEVRQGVNVTVSRCEKVRCECIAGTQICDPWGADLTEILADVTGPATMTCKDPGFKGGYNCEFDETVLRTELGPMLGSNPVIELDCEYGQCIDSAEIPYFSPSKEADMQLIYIIGGLGVFATVALLGVVLFYVRKMRRERTYRVSMGAGDAADDAVANELQSMIESGHHLPVTLAFRNLTYELPNGSNNRVRILKGVHGVVKPGEVMAILGASGAGKSTCLDILGGKTKRGVVQGEILINGKAPTRRQYKRISGFVDQEDKLMGTLTVYEALLYSAMLRLPKTMSHAAKERRVRETMVELGIEHIANTKIGIAGKRGISGGEKRRVSIAMEVVTSPSILFLDEPTSGLDSFNAQTVVQSLVTLAKRYNRTIVLSIHQPRSNIFAMFDRLLLLAEGGYTVYSGPIVKRPQLIDTGVAAADVERPTTSAPEYVLRNWLEEMHIQCPAGFNLADYLIDLTKMGTMEAPLSPIDDQFDGSDTSAPVRNRKTTSSSTTHGSEIGSTSSSDGRSASPKRALRQLAYPTTHGFHLPIDPSDYAELAVKRPQIQTLVGGFFRSDVCLALKQEIEQQAASARTGTLAQPIVAAQQTSAMVPHPSSPSIVLETGEAAGDHDDMPLLAGNSSDGSSTLIETRSEPPAYEYLFPGLGNLLNSTWNMSAADEEASFRPSFWMQFRILSGRTFINFYRNPALMWAHYGMAIGAALLYGSVFWQVPDNIGGFQNRLGIFFFSFAVFGFGSLSSLALFVEERTLFMRERAGGYYTVTAYFLSKIMFDILPLRVIPPVVFGSICYFMVGLRPDMEHFLKFQLVLVLFNLAVAAICLLIAISHGNNIGLANLTSVVVLLMSMTFGGFFLNKRHLSPSVSWIPYLSMYNYAIEALMVNELADITLVDNDQIVPVKVPGAVILHTFGFDILNYWNDVYSLGWMFLIVMTLAYIVLQVFVKERR